MTKRLIILCVCLIRLMVFKSMAQDINIPSAVILPSPPQTTYVVAAGQTAYIMSGASIVLKPGSTLSPGCTVHIKINPLWLPPAAPSSPASDFDKNWVLSRTYDESGNEISTSKQFFDNNGKATQAQTKNETSKQVIASQTLYDLQGRAVLNTLPAPINNTAFAYNNNFITSGGTPYSYLNFDGDPANTSNPYAKLNAPDPVDNTQAGSLGWYYSNNNTLEPTVAATGFPYSRGDFYRDGTGVAKRAAGVAEPLKMGTGHEATANSFLVGNELNNYLAIRNQFFANAVGNAPASMAGQALQSISTDQNGTSALSVTDLSGKMTLMSGRADPSAGAWLPVTNTMNLSNITPGYTFSVVTYGNVIIPPGPGPGNGGLYVNNGLGFSIRSANTVQVYQSGSTTPIYNGPGNGFSFTPVILSTAYFVTSASPFTISASENDGTAIYDQAEAPYTEPANTSIQYFQLTSPSTVTITGNYVLYNMASETDITASFQANNTLSAGYYKVIATTVPANATGTNNVTVTYTNKYSDISYNYYNQLGQLIASIPPNGVQTLLQNGYGSYTTASQLPFVTLYQYNLLGRLISTTTPDGGTSNFIYRQDGKIRFSQNAFQANPANHAANQETYSYSFYDYAGRVISSGEFAADLGTYAGLASNNELLEQTGIPALDGSVLGVAIQNTGLLYDFAGGTGVTGYVQDVGFMKGAVSAVGNASSITYYNYDDHGRVAWMVKQLYGLGRKTVDYTYNDQGNVVKVDYQKNTAAERFIHYYNYDADGRLVNVQTSRDDIAKVQHANYYYSLTGQLKRTEFADELQGLDYTYTPQGWLKAVNSPTGNAANDPMKDGISNGFAKDAFGLQLEYFANDYSRSGSAITSIPTGNQSYYNGTVTGMSWQSNKPTIVVGSVGTSIQNPVMYSYTYDPKYQYTQSVWGTPNYTNGTFAASSNNMFQEKGISYDFNGNIKALQHTGSTGTLVDNFTYNYTPNTNKLASVANAVGSTTYGTYTYNEIGQLKSQANPIGTTYLRYDATGKIIGIFSDAAMTTPIEVYIYDEAGNRIVSINYTGTQPVATYYVYDATGNVLAIYTGGLPNSGATPTLAEVPVYGSGRVATYFVSANNYVYEIRDNVGSVRLTINRTKNSSGQADVSNFDDYYPYGSIAQSGGVPYRYDYQGAYAEKDPVTGYNNFQLRMYDARIGRWLSVDPQGQYTSPYEGMGNNPVTMSDPTGGRDTTTIDDNTGKSATWISNTALNVTLHGQWITPTNFQYNQSRTEYTPNPNFKNPNLWVWDPKLNPGIVSNKEADEAAWEELSWASAEVGGPLIGRALGFAGKKVVIWGATKIIENYAEKAAAEAVLSRAQAAAVAAGKVGYTTMKGGVVDAATKASVLKNVLFKSVIDVTPRFKFGPDFVGKGILEGTWWDVTTTTTGIWENHVAKYVTFGEGIPVYYK